MASEDIKEALKAAAVQIRDEKLAGANTAWEMALSVIIAGQIIIPAEHIAIMI